MTLTELAAKLGATLARGDGQRSISGIASLEAAGPEDLAPFLGQKFAELLERTNAGAVLTGPQPPANVPPQAALLCAPDPELAWIKALHLIYPEISEKPGVASTAVIETDVDLGAGVHVGPYAVIRSGSKLGPRCTVLAHAVIGRGCILGEDCVLHPHVVLYDRVKLGRRVMIHSGSIIGADGFGYKFSGGRHHKVPQVGIVDLGDDVEIGANTCVDRATLDKTSVGAGTKIDNLVQIGHNNNIGQHCILCGQVGLAGSCVLDDYVILGGNVGLADHVHMGKGAKAGAKSGVSKSCPSANDSKACKECPGSEPKAAKACAAK